MVDPRMAAPAGVTTTRRVHVVAIPVQNVFVLVLHVLHPFEELRVLQNRRGTEAMTGSLTTSSAASSVDVVASEPRSDRWAVARDERWPSLAGDVALCVALFAAALWVRGAVPRDGLFYDDAWQAFGAEKGLLRQLYFVGQTQPGFTAALFVWSRLFGSGPATMVLPARIAGALGPPALYLFLRRFGYARSVAFLLSAILAVSTTDVLASSRVKTYTTDVLVTLVAALVVDRLCTRPWTRRTAALWVAAATAVAAFTEIGPILAVAAGITLVLQARDDRRLRMQAVGIQFAILACYVLAITRTYNGRLEKGYWLIPRGFIEFRANPLQLAHNVVRHLVRVIQTFPGGPQPWPDVALVVVVIGLAIACRRGPRMIVSRFLIIATLLAMGASLAQRVPFGPLDPSPFGARITLWLIPVIAIGLAEILEMVRDKVVRRGARRAFDTIVPIVAVLALFTTTGVTYSYPGAGGRAATRYVMTNLEPRDSVWISRAMMYSFALYSGSDVRVRAAPREEVGFLPAFSDPRLTIVLLDAATRALGRSIAHAQRVWVVLPPTGLADRAYLAKLETTLMQNGFVRSNVNGIQTVSIEQWDRAEDWFGTKAASACGALRAWATSNEAAYVATLNGRSWITARTTLVRVIGDRVVAYQSLIKLAEGTAQSELRYMIGYSHTLANAASTASSIAGFKMASTQITVPRVFADNAIMLGAAQHCTKS